MKTPTRVVGSRGLSDICKRSVASTQGRRNLFYGERNVSSDLKPVTQRGRGLKHGSDSAPFAISMTKQTLEKLEEMDRVKNKFARESDEVSVYTINSTRSKNPVSLLNGVSHSVDERRR